MEVVSYLNHLVYGVQQGKLDLKRPTQAAIAWIQTQLSKKKGQAPVTTTTTVPHVSHSFKFTVTADARYLYDLRSKRAYELLGGDDIIVSATTHGHVVNITLVRNGIPKKYLDHSLQTNCADVRTIN